VSIGKKNKDNLKSHAAVALATPPMALKSDDPLLFWTNHPAENALIDLRPFADGEAESPHPRGGGIWGGPFAGRPKLIAELAPAIQARCALRTYGQFKKYAHALRAWWRLLDKLETNVDAHGVQFTRVDSLAHLNEFHEAAAHREGLSSGQFGAFLLIVNDARRLLHLPVLLWVVPKPDDPDRTLIPEDQAREIKTAIKQDWESVRRTWVRNDAIIEEAERRAAGKTPAYLDEEGEYLLKNFQHFQSIRKRYCCVLPSSEQLADGLSKQSLSHYGLALKLMRSIMFPTVEEADIAFHLALMNSGWNPSTMMRLDALSPTVVAAHPKSESQVVLSVNEEEYASIQADKPRARGKTQFCTGLKKHTSSPPAIVASQLQRVRLLREILIEEHKVASNELACLQAAGERHDVIQQQVMRVQKLREGCMSVWLYVSPQGKINWLKYPGARYERSGRSAKPISYLWLVLERLNTNRAAKGRAIIPYVTPSDFRDIYARWVYTKSGGNILAVMMALGHSSPRSTGRYLDNNIFSAENDEHAKRFMSHLFSELERGRMDLTILTQLVRHGSITQEMESRLEEYRKLKRSRVGAGCADPRHPPSQIAPGHTKGRLCGSHRCLKSCPHAKFLPESLDGIAMRVEELQEKSYHLPRETWIRGEFEEELDTGEYLLSTLYSPGAVAAAREKWRQRIASGTHLIPGL
jgi:hypothetical protein